MTDSADALFTGTPLTPLRYAQMLAEALWEKHWKTDAPEWQVQPDLVGVLTQIDNMTAGLVRAVGQTSRDTP